FLVDITTGKARPTLLEDILRIIFSSDVLSPRDKVNIACASKEFKALVFEALLSERTLKAWTTAYSRHTRPAAIAQSMTRLSGLRHIEVLSDVRFCWWSWLSAFSNVSSLRSLSMVITETGEEHHEQYISHKYLTRLRNAQFNSRNQFDNLRISIRDTGRTSTRVLVGFSRTLQPIYWVQRFLNIPTIRSLSIIRPNLQSFLNLNTLRISTTLGEKTLFTTNSGQTTYIPLNPDSGPHETSHSEIFHILSRSIPFEEYFPCGLKINTSFTYTASCDEIRHFFAIFGTDFRIPLLSIYEGYLSGWSRYCSSTLRSVWIRRSVSEHWETAGETVFPEPLRRIRT
ncbi:hypothetical protein BDQ17DRAFT_1364482, partial [Cyathus striatus]